MGFSVHASASRTSEKPFARFAFGAFGAFGACAAISAMTALIIDPIISLLL
jgi:hypothetical protein